MTKSIFMVESNHNGAWEPLPEGGFDTQEAAERGVQSLLALGEDYRADRLRVVEYTGDRAAAYAR